MSGKSTSQTASANAENRLKKIRKLESNMTCPNCGTRGQQGIGFGNVCVKYKTFVCDSCKTSHQAISHRVKSVTMSTWTEAEVDELLDQNGGGNLACQHIWLAKAPIYGGRYSGGGSGSGGGYRPKQGDRIEIFKNFVVDAYEYQLFKADTPYVPTAAAAHGTSSAPTASSSLNSSTSATPTTSGKHSQPPLQQQQQVVASLLSMDEDPFTTTTTTSTLPVPPQPSSSLSTSAFSMSYSDSHKVRAFDDFGVQPPQKVIADPFGYPVAAGAPPAATVPIAPVPSRATSASATPPPPPQVDLLSYDDFSAPVSTSRPAGSTNDTNWLDLMSAPPVSAPTASSMRGSAMIGAPIGAAIPTAAIPPVMKAQTIDPFGSISLQPANAGPAYPINPGSAMNRGIPSTGPGSVPMTGMMGYGNNRMQSTSPMMMAPSVGPSLASGAFPSSTTPPPMRPSPMMGGPMMNGGKLAISALDSTTGSSSYRPSQPTRPAQDSFGFLQDTMRQQLENSR